MKEQSFEIKKSTFIGFFSKVTSVSEVEELLKEIKKQHKKAKHICFAYKIISSGTEHVKFSDDGEPTGTAGRPILSVIEKKKLENVVIFVVRYFGGIKLGSGGLIRAYTKTASMVSENENN